MLNQSKIQSSKLFEGSMEVIERTNSNTGDTFKVANLNVGIGVFRVQLARESQKVLLELDEGNYTGKFLVTKIFQKPYVWNNSLRADIMAYVEDMELDVLNELDESSKQVDIDVDLDEDAGTPEPTVNVVSTESQNDEDSTESAGTSTQDDKDESSDEENTKSAVDPDEELFGYLYPIGNVVRLDETTPRPVFTRQKERLKKELGYEYEFRKRVWVKSEVLDDLAEKEGIDRADARLILAEEFIDSQSDELAVSA